MARAKKAKGGPTPFMQQFFKAKEEAPDALLFFRMGDFYELFHEDAVIAAEALDITLTARGKKGPGEAIPMAGVPHHSAASYLARLLEKGFKVAICEQLADPKTVKGIVPRGIVRTVTPGLTLDPDTLDARADNLLVALRALDGGGFGVAALELSQAELRAGESDDAATAMAELARLEPRELLLVDVSEELAGALGRLLPRTVARTATPADPATVSGFLQDEGAELGPGARAAAAQVLVYAQSTQPATPLRLERAAPLHTAAALRLDEVAARNLELVRTLGGERKGSLLALLDRTQTPMGARLLRRRLLAPLADLEAIRDRHDAVDALFDDGGLREDLRGQLAAIGDVERLATRAEACTRRSPRATRPGSRSSKAFASTRASVAFAAPSPSARSPTASAWSVCGPWLRPA